MNDVDVFIAGGGLAGLTLARQLHQAERRCGSRWPRSASILRPSGAQCLLVQRRDRAQYFGRTSSRAALQAALPTLVSLPFPSGENRDVISDRVGPPLSPGPVITPDRGLLENFLVEENRSAGIEVLDQAIVKRLDLGSPHHIEVAARDGHREFTARWLVDATGRSGLIRRRLGLTRPVGHAANACWFRLRRCVRIDEWSDDPTWRAQVASGQRWHSTTHLIGRGYWVWLIPLGSGGISIGIVVDETLHPWHRLNRFERAMEWLHEYEPQCAQYMERERDQVEDFLALRHYAHGSAQVFSADRWLLTGEAGVFTDPFYSPGSDFIAIGNDLITDVILRDRRGEDVSARIEQHNRHYLRLFDAFCAFTKPYPLGGNAPVMTRKRRVPPAPGRWPRPLPAADADFALLASGTSSSHVLPVHARMQLPDALGMRPVALRARLHQHHERGGAEAATARAVRAADGRRRITSRAARESGAARTLCTVAATGGRG